jgi:hypothetical protein
MISRLKICLAVCLAVLLPQGGHAWGPSGHRLIASKAVETLPPELRGFFESSRNELARHCTEPLDWLARNPDEKTNQFIHLDRYGTFPFEALPRDYKTAVKKHTEKVVRANGVLPWNIGVYSEKLTKAFKAGDWDEARRAAAHLAYYVAEAHHPFSTTVNSEGQESGQRGVNSRFGSTLVDRFSPFFFVRPNEAVYIEDPTDHAFEICLSAHSWLENILLSDRRAKRTLGDYSDEYYDRFYNQAGAILIREISDASTDVGSYWLTAWINAGRPALPTR